MSLDASDVMQCAFRHLPSALFKWCRTRQNACSATFAAEVLVGGVHASFVHARLEPSAFRVEI